MLTTRPLGPERLRRLTGRYVGNPDSTAHLEPSHSGRFQVVITTDICDILGDTTNWLIGYSCHWQSMSQRDADRGRFSYLSIIGLGLGGRGYNMDFILFYAFDFAMVVVNRSLVLK